MTRCTSSGNSARVSLDWLNEVAAILQVLFGLVGLVLGWLALQVARKQLRPIAEQLRKEAAEKERLERLKGEQPRELRELVGFDPRFTRSDWKGVLTLDRLPPATLTSSLTRSYSEFYRNLDDDLRNGIHDDHVLIVDLLFVPHLLHEGLIAPLTTTEGLALDPMLHELAKLIDVQLDPPAIDMMRELCSDEDGVLGALPLWINTHGRMIPRVESCGSRGRPAQVASFDELLDHADAADLLAEAGIQSHYMVFEFLAHLAYRDCRLFESKGRHAITSSLGNPSSPERRSFAEAIADLAVRLHFYRATSDVFRRARVIEDFDQDAFRLEHAGDARMIRERLAQWKPLFSSELLWRTLPQRSTTPEASLADNVNFHPPFVRQASNDSWLYLSALGGYGLALPTAAASDPDSVRALKYVFLSNPLLMHPYVNDMLSAESETHPAQDFVRRYGRPRWPFWPEIEQALVETLLQLLLTLPRRRRGRPRVVWERHARSLQNSDEANACVATFLNEVERIAHGAGWQFSRTAR